MTITINAYKHKNQRDIVIKVAGLDSARAPRRICIQRGKWQLLQTGEWSEQQMDWLSVTVDRLDDDSGDVCFTLKRELTSSIDPGPVTFVFDLDDDAPQQASYHWPYRFATLCVAPPDPDYLIPDPDPEGY